MNYFPSLPQAQQHCCSILRAKAEPYTVKELPHSQTITTIYRHGSTRRLLGTIDLVVISPDDIRQAGQDLASFKFDKHRLATAYYFTDFVR